MPDRKTPGTSYTGPGARISSGATCGFSGKKCSELRLSRGWDEKDAGHSCQVFLVARVPE